MKKLSPIVFDDIAALDNMASNKKLKSFGKLNKEKQKILDAYRVYINSQGNGIGFSKTNLSHILNQHMLDHYNSAPTIIKKAILTIRNSLSPDVCPMCGNLGSGGQADHIFPKADFQEFAIFTKNLVPSCKCNNLRGSSFTGTGSERVLHPYFDSILKERLIVTKFHNLPTMLAAETQVADLIILEQNDEIIDAVKFHIENIVKKTAILDSLRKTYGKFLRKPQTFIFNILNTPININELRQNIQQLVESYDEEYETPNNWKSILFSGMLFDEGLMLKLVPHINGLISGSIDPELI